MIVCTFLTLQTHVLVLVRVRQTVLQQAVDQNLVSILGSSSHRGQIVRSIRHALSSCCNHDVRISSYYSLRADDYGLDRGSAHFVHRRGDCAFGQSSTEDDLTGGILAETTIQS